MAATLFAHYPATPGAVEASGDKIHGLSGSFTTSGRMVTTAVRTASTETAGLLSEPVQQTSGPVVRQTAQLSRAALLGGGVVVRFGDSIRTFDRGVDRLNERYATAASSGFGVPAADYTDAHDQSDRSEVDQVRTGKVSAARGDLVAQLKREYLQLQADLDDAAQAGAGMLSKGPTDANLRTLLLAGALPSSALPQLPGLRLSDADVRALLANLRRTGRLDEFLAAKLGPPSADLGERLDLARRMGLDPRAYKQLLQTYWQAVSMEKAGINWDEWDLSRGAAALRPIIERVYEYYGTLYQDNPRLRWAGLANLVGPSFAAGFLDLNQFKELAGALKDKLGKIPGPVRERLPFPLNDLDDVANMGEDEFGWWENKFLDMQQQIFLDMGSMNTAYTEGGMDAIQEMYDAGIFERSDSNSQASEQTLQAWRLIDGAKGPNAAEDLNKAAELMAYREQHDIIQDDYDDMRDHPGGEAFTRMLTLAGQVSVPGSQTMGSYSPLEIDASVTVDPLGPGKSTTSVHASAPIPTGNVADWDDRWDYFTHDTLPAYTDILDNPANPNSMDDIMSRDMGERIDDYRIVNRVDDLAGDFVDDIEFSVEQDFSW